MSRSVRPLALWLVLTALLCVLGALTIASAQTPTPCPGTCPTPQCGGVCWNFVSTDDLTAITEVEIWRKLGASGTYALVGTRPPALAGEFIDLTVTGGVTGQTYCWRVRSTGPTAPPDTPGVRYSAWALLEVPLGANTTEACKAIPAVVAVPISTPRKLRPN